MKISREELLEALMYYNKHHTRACREEQIVDMLYTLGIEVEEPGILDEEWVKEPQASHIEIVCLADIDCPKRAASVSRYVDAVVAVPDTLRALVMVRDRSSFTRFQSGARNADVITVEFNPDQWRVITDALDKAGIE